MNNIRSKPPVNSASKIHLAPHQSKPETKFIQISLDSQPIQSVNNTNSSELCIQHVAEKSLKLGRKNLKKFLNATKTDIINLTNIKKEDQSINIKEKCIPIIEKPKKNKHIRESMVTNLI